MPAFEPVTGRPVLEFWPVLSAGITTTPPVLVDADGDVDAAADVLTDGEALGLINGKQIGSRRFSSGTSSTGGTLADVLADALADDRPIEDGLGRSLRPGTP
jgi:hypothetical protein